MKYSITAFFYFMITTFTYSIKAQTVDSNYLDGVVYVKIKASSSMELDPYDTSNSTLNQAIIDYSIDSMIKPFPDMSEELDKTYRIYFSDYAEFNNLIITLKLISDMEYVEKAPLYKINLTPNDLNAAQSYLNIINAPKAWDITTGSSNIVVAIVDNGILLTHQDLQANIWNNLGEVENGLDEDLNGYPDDVNGWDVSDNDNNPNPPASTTDSDPFVHGTLVGGIAGAVTNNNIGIASIGYHIQLMAVKCAPDNENGESLPDAYDGIFYATRAEADIINMSFGGSQGSFITGQNLVNAAHNAGIVLVAAAGNNNSSNPYYPAAYSNVIAVGAIDDNSNKSSYSNYGNYIDVVAPGNRLLTTSAGTTTSYGSASGTSLACPIVAGLAGLILSDNPALSNEQVRTKIKNGAVNIDGQNPDFIGQLGAGRIDAFNAVSGTINTFTVDRQKDLVFKLIDNGVNYILRLNANNILDVQKSNASVTISNILGQVMYERSNFEVKKGIFIPKTSLPRGMFLFTVQVGDYSTTKKISGMD